MSSSVDVAAVRFFKGRFEPGTRHSAKIYDSLTGSLLATTGNFTDLVHTPIQHLLLPPAPTIRP